jgi:PTEN phosphatase family protein
MFTLSTGGKGRTGTMICALLLYLGRHSAAEQALLAFSDRRTDVSLASKFQGVETPSQARYVGYFADWLQQSIGCVRPPPSTLTPITARLLQLQRMRLVALIGVGIGDGSDLTCRIEVDRREQFMMDFGASLNCLVDYKGEQDALDIQPINCPALVGDVRIRFYCKSRKVPVGYDACAFYFWFNTAFVPGDHTKLHLTRTELDNPHKSKTWKVFRERFAVDLDFDPTLTAAQSSPV